MNNLDRYRNPCKKCNTTDNKFIPKCSCKCTDNDSDIDIGFPSGGSNGDFLVKNGNSWIWKSKLSGDSIENNTIKLINLSSEVTDAINNSSIYNNTVGF